MAEDMTRLVCTLSLRKRPWADAFLEVLAVTCAVASVLSIKAAEWMSDKGTSVVARHGFKIIVTPGGASKV